MFIFADLLLFIIKYVPIFLVNMGFMCNFAPFFKVYFKN